MMFNVIHTLILVPLVIGGAAVGSAFGPVLGAIDGYHLWKKVKVAHEQDLKEAKEVQK